MRQRAVLTGGAGFVGSHLAERLLELDIEVVCLDNFITGSADNVAHLQSNDGFRLIKTDVSDFVSIPGPVDYVLHFASPASPIDYAQLPIQTLKVGSLGTLHTLGLAKEKGARYLLASTSETYGDPLVHPQPETYWGNVNPVGPRACYDEAKRFAEALTVSYRAKHGVNTAIMRIFNTYGPRMRPNDGRAIPNFIQQALTGSPLTVHGDGSQTRSVCHVDDLVEGALKLLFSDLAGPVNIGNPHEMTMLELAELIRELSGSESPLDFVDRPRDDPSRRQPDISLARAELGWEPQVDARDGLRETINWFRDRDAGTSTTNLSAPVRLHAKQPRHKVAVVGTGYVGAVTATCLAFLGHDVCGLDSDSTRAGQLNNGQTPFVEPGLPDILKSTLASGRLRFTDQPAEALTDADFVFLCVGTPPGADGSPDLSQLEGALNSLAPHLRTGAVIVNKSTVPVGSGNWTRTVLEDALDGDRQVSFRVVSNPEFLREGCAIDDFLYPDRIVLGGAASEVKRVAELYQPVLDQSFHGGRREVRPSLITTELASAEMIKYAANAFLATKISFANEMAQMCELFGADVRQVLPAIGADHRVGRAFLAPGVGWGGSCFGKDVSALISSSQEYGYTPSMLQATVDINRMQRASAVRKLQRELHILKGRRIAMFGLTFKPGTDDLRDSPALDIARRLLAAGAVVSAYDPVVKALPAEYGAIRLAPDVYEAADRADAVVLATEWPEFQTVDAGSLRRAMRGDLVVDGRNCLPESTFIGSGLRLVGFGW
ncbi:nucleotide sugar dehydrogenase [Mycobacterium sp. 852013-51886_SCH5428379]|uniref:UDP-glucuronate decarboxylase n=1 Tax=Mycobacterium sp. 852013-51886_SCH5428379 TaxID=1834111 RepID=UPI0007FE6551|nr:UDP-glucuronate decarboxylase [Mycobacterium sp. 852013-51886_SCH5428379]OBB57168.1 nucleotide sugar dehydrogenase [Mycobacterium sp. 852013-51886_SCH5428379]